MRQTKKLHGVFKSIESAVQSANRTRVNLAEKGRFSDASEKQEEENGSCTLDSDQYPSVLVFSVWILQPAHPSKDPFCQEECANVNSGRSQKWLFSHKGTYTPKAFAPLHN